MFSPDSRHVGYGVLIEQTAVMVWDGVPGRRYRNTFAPCFSPDSRRFAYGAFEEQTNLVVLDGKESKRYPGLGGTGKILVVFSPDSKRVAFGAVQINSSGKKAAIVVVDGVEGPRFDLGLALDTLSSSPHLSFSPDSRSFAYVGARNPPAGGTESPQYFVVLNGKEYGPYRPCFLPTFSPDGKHAAWGWVVEAADGALRVQIVVDGVAQEIDGVTGIVPGARLVYDDPTHFHSLIIAEKGIMRLDVEIAPGPGVPARK